MISKPKLIACLGDSQSPYHDKKLHALVLDWLKDEKPDQLVTMGDMLDLPDISKHAPKRGYNHSVSEVIESGRDLLNDYAMASGSRCKSKLYLPGNHDVRVDNYLLQHAEKIAHLYSNPLPRELEFDKIGFKWVSSPHGGPDYPYAMVQLAPGLGATHGWIVRKGAGASALATVETCGHSILVGHVHRTAIVSRTYHNLDGSLRTLTGVETGTLARVEGGLGFAPRADWAQGFAVVSVWPDGVWTPSLVSYRDGTLTWQGPAKRYTAAESTPLAPAA